MKNFLIGLVLSTALMFGVVYTTVINPSLFVNLFGVEPTEIEETIPVIDDTGVETSSNASYLERIEKGDILMEENYFPLAAIEYQFATDLEPNLSEPFAKLGAAYFYDEKYENAFSSLNIAVTNNPTNTEAQILFGKTLIALEQFDTAKTQFATIDATDQRVLYHRGLLSAYFGEYSAAETYFNQAIEAGTAAELSQNAQNFLSSMNEAALSQDANPNYLKTLIGRSLAETDQSTLAISLLYDVLSAEPDYRDAWIIMGYTYLTVGQYIDARDALIEALERDPTKDETRYFLGMAYFGLDEYAAAVPQFELAIESGFEPRVQAYQQLADAATLAQEYEKAAEAYENVLVLSDTDPELYIRPVWIYIDKLNNVDRAMELGEQAITNHPNAAMSYNLLGWAKIASNDFEAAEQNLSYALVLDPDLAAAYLNYGWLHQQRGDNESAKENYKRAYTIDPGGSIGNLAADRYNTLVQQEQQPPEEPSPTP